MSLEQEVELIRQFPIFSKIQPAMQKLLCFSAEPTAIKFSPRQLHLFAHNLEQLFVTIPTKSGTQNRMSRDDLPPRLLESGHVESSTNAEP